MSDRARLSKLKTWTESSPPGSEFLGSTDFPAGLVEAVEKWDPVGLFSRGSDGLHDPSDEEQKRLVPLMRQYLQGKRILNLAGGADKLVPYNCGKPFLTWLKKAIGNEGWFKDGGILVKDKIFDGVGHEMSEGMVQEVLRFLKDISTNVHSDVVEQGLASKTSKM